MKLKLFPSTCVLTLLLTTVALGGDMPGPGALSKPPQPDPVKSMPAICEPLESRGGETSSSDACEEATPSDGWDAIIFAIGSLLALY